MSEAIRVEVVFAAPDSQSLQTLKLPLGATVGDAIAHSGLARDYPQYSFAEMPVGIWGHTADSGQQLKDGDRVEVCRELLVDPMEARRLRATERAPDPSESR